MSVTQRQLVETVSGLRSVARDLRENADGEPIEKTKGRAVPSSVTGLRSHADFLERAADEILQLIDNENPVKVPLKD